MAAKDEEFLKKLLVTFSVEAEEHINAISAGLVELEKVSSRERQMEIIEIVFREAHSLKGAARAVKMAKVEAICQTLETIFSGLKAQEVALSPDLFDRLHQMLAAAGAETGTVNQSRLAETPEPPEASLRTAIQQSSLPSREATDVRPAGSVTSLRPVAEKRSGLPDTVRVSTLKIDSLLRQAEELISSKAAGAHRLAELREVNATVSLWEKEWRKMRPEARAIRRSFERDDGAVGQISLPERQEKTLPRIPSLLAFLERNETALQSIKSQLTSVAQHLQSDHRALDRRAEELLNEVKGVSMLPFSTLLMLFPKLVRDLCRDCGKDAELAIEGGDIETDRRILEEMKDPLIHLVRNCVDHGIEHPKEREQRQKPLTATLRVAISPKSRDKVEIVVSDDGAGIDVQKVQATAVKLGLVSQDDAQKMDEQEALSLVFQSGVSTSPMITDVSGRGLGLAIVREKAEKLGGAVSVETRPGIGTTFRVILPLRLATFRGILVRVGDHFFVLPTMHVQRVLRLCRDEIKSAENRETLQISGQAVSLVRLGQVLGIAERSLAPDPKRKIPVVVLAWAGEQLAFVVDEILSDQEVLVKGLGKQLPHVRNFAGATILGTGKVLPVLNVADLVRSAVRTAGAAPAHEAEEKPKSVLVAEDSITARTLLKNILESAGYSVKTAVDGAEALAALGREDFDLVVSDVDMPRMSGLDLAAKIRADKKLSKLPVVLVTALESREDRERGIDVGANAYIVKSSFDQSNLLEAVRRLI
ncbi:MAG TPA: response regulator [Terriglobia bacterium]|nr:response regulator [Terriglobia bacterium]